MGIFAERKTQNATIFTASFTPFPARSTPITADIHRVFTALYADIPHNVVNIPRCTNRRVHLDLHHPRIRFVMKVVPYIFVYAYGESLERKVREMLYWTCVLQNSEVLAGQLRKDIALEKTRVSKERKL